MQVARGRKGRPKRKPKGQDSTESEPQERSEERKNAIVKMVAEGAYRKATMAMIKQGEVITGSECGHWADVLHPRLGNQDGVLTQPKDEQPNRDPPVQGSPPRTPAGRRAPPTMRRVPAIASSTPSRECPSGPSSPLDPRGSDPSTSPNYSQSGGASLTN